MCQVLRAHYVSGTVLGLGSRGHTDNGSCPHGSLVLPQELFKVFCPFHLLGVESYVRFDKMQLKCPCPHQLGALGLRLYLLNKNFSLN